MNIKHIAAICASLLLAALLFGCAAAPVATDSPSPSTVPVSTIPESTPTLAPTPTIPIENENTPPDDEPTADELIPEELDVLYVPGTYIGEGDGHDGMITVTVKVDQSSIISLSVTDHSESMGTSAIDAIPAAIVARQTTDVDAVSGSTVTSDAIVDAVNNALELAMG